MKVPQEVDSVDVVEQCATGYQMREDGAVLGPKTQSSRYACI